MRIVTWNCCMGLSHKAERLSALQPDIAIVQECSLKSVADLATIGLSGRWFGSNPNKGLAVLHSNAWKLNPLSEVFGRWVVPLRVSGRVEFNLVAVWACKVGNRLVENYIGQVYGAASRKSSWFRGAPTVVAGDFNSNSQWDSARPGRNHTEVVRMFESYNLKSAYHVHFRENQGSETRPTHYFRHHEHEPFHIDYVFVPKSWRIKSVEVGSFKQWGKLSDHVPCIVDVMPARQIFY